MEPLPPGVLPNFPPHYPFKWQQKIMPTPHPNHLRSMGLPATFCSYDRHSNPGHGGYTYRDGFEGQAGPHSNGGQGYGDGGEGYGNDGEGYDNGEYYGNDGDGYDNGECSGNDGEGYSHAHTDEEYFEDRDGYNTYGDEGSQYMNEDHCSNTSAQFHNVPYDGHAPIPRSKDHYYNLAPKVNQHHNRGAGNSSFARKKQLAKHYGNRFCDGCEVGFYSVESFQAHLEDHVPCPYPNCPVQATLEKLDGHITDLHLLHSSASRQIDTKKYIEERKRNYPSSKRTEMKLLQVDKQRKRGELLGLDEKLDVKEDESHAEDVPEIGDPTHVNSHEYEPLREKKYERKRRHQQDKQKNYKKNKPANYKTEAVQYEHVDNIIVVSRVPEFCGIDCFYEESGQKSVLASTIADDRQVPANSEVLAISDDEDFTPAVAATPTADAGASDKCSAADGGSGGNSADPSDTKPSVGCGALGLLMGDYGSDSDNDESNMAGDFGPTSTVDIEISSESVDSKTRCSLTEMDVIVTNSDDKQGLGTDMPAEGTNDEAKGQMDSEMTADLEVNESEDLSTSAKKNKRRRGKRGRKNKSKLSSRDNEEEEHDSDNSIEMSNKETERLVRASSDQTADVNSIPGLIAIDSKVDNSNGDDSKCFRKSLTSAQKEHNLASMHVKKKQRKFNYKYRQSLFEKLFSNQIQHERNVLLQCAKYIVDNNYFEQTNKSGTGCSNNIGNDATTDAPHVASVSKTE